MTTAKKKYNVFISYTQADRQIAKEIQLFIKEEFNGEIVPFLAGDDIKSGDKWKETIKQNITIGDAIISLITPNSKSKPWLFVEWSAFWMADKDMHIFLSDELKHTDLIHPMQDFQYVAMTNVDSMKGFFQKLAKAADFRPAPYDKAEDFIVSIKASIQKQQLEEKQLSFDRFGDKSVDLPTDDLQKKAIAEYFILKEDFTVFKRLFSVIREEGIKSKLISYLIKLQKYDIAIEHAQEIRTPELQRDIIIDLLDEPIDLKRIYPLLEAVAKKNQPQMRIILNELVDQGKENEGFFTKTLSFTDNTPTLHKVASHLIANDKMESGAFGAVVTKIYQMNAAESRKLGEEMIDGKLEETKQFDEIVRGMAKKNQIETVKLLLFLKEYNFSVYEKYTNAGIITSDAALRRLNGNEAGDKVEENKLLDEIFKAMVKKDQVEAANLLLVLKEHNLSLFQKYVNSGIITSPEALRRLNHNDNSL
jgi:hypothetical protein